MVMSYEKGSASVWGWCEVEGSLSDCKEGNLWYYNNGWYRDMDASWNYESLWEDECWHRGRYEVQPIAELPRGTRELPPDSSNWIFEIVVNRQFMVYIGVLASVFVIALLSIVTCYKRYTGPKVMVYDSNWRWRSKYGILWRWSLIISDSVDWGSSRVSQSRVPLPLLPPIDIALRVFSPLGRGNVTNGIFVHANDVLANNVVYLKSVDCNAS